jgi:hypothetical protein
MTSKNHHPAPAGLAGEPLPPVFGKEIHTHRETPPTLPPGAKDKKRDNIFSQSRDVREDRGEREIKTAHNPSTNHARP